MGHVDTAIMADAIEFPLPWGPVVRGLRWGSGSDSVLLLHEPGADIDAWGLLPGQLATALGIQSLAVDLPGHGLSDDPWQPEMAAAFVRFLAKCSSEGGALTQPARPPNPSPIAMGERGAHVDHGTRGRRFLVAADIIATAALTCAAEFPLAGIVALSPNTDSKPPSPIAMGEGLGVRAVVPKLMIAGSLAENDLETARHLASTSGGWTVVTSIPVSERGTGLLTTPWGARVAGEIIGFLRDCLHPRPASLPGNRIAPRLPG